MTSPTLADPRPSPPAATFPTGALLPRHIGPRADTLCLCGGLLAYLAGRWRHVDICLDCLPAADPACRSQHRGCDTPEPVPCTHLEDWRCTEPVSLEAKCAHARPDQSCCSCCWIVPRDDR